MQNTNDPTPLFSAQPSEDCADPLTSAASGLIAIGIPRREVSPEAQRSVENALRRQVMQIERDDFSGMEVMMVAQAQMLHRIFAQAIGKYAQAQMPEEARPYAGIALKAQSYCRMTVNSLAQMKTMRFPQKSGNELLSDGFYPEKSGNELLRTPFGTQKSRNELLSNDWDDHVEPAGGAGGQASADSWLAVMREAGGAEG